MALEVGSRLGHYDVTALIGEGGMGQVYQATDAKLGRQVALKILPEAFATDPDRLARFQREAQVLASLNHPNIGHIYGLEEAEGTKALVLELIEGPTLADRIKQGPIPIDEALSIAKQIAEALEAAHEAGVIHRDLKPANIKVREDGTVKVLDFGLAKAMERERSHPSASPTITAAATQQGVILGTAAYMSPEQARGRPVDKRTDIWSFGCVVFEMLAGQTAFGGRAFVDTIANILDHRVSWELLPTETPSHVRRLLERCLAKEARDRLRDIGDARLELSGPGEPQAVGVLDRANRPSGSAANTIASRLIGAAVVGGLVAGLTVWWLRPVAPEASPFVTRATVSVPATDQLAAPNAAIGSPVALSQDGSTLAYIARRNGIDQVFVRYLDQLDERALPDTEGATEVFFSPDGESVGFIEGNVLKRIALTGGAAVTVHELESVAHGASWGPDDSIVFGRHNSSIWRIPSVGGTPVPITSLEPEDVDHANPHVLPGGTAVMFRVQTVAGGPNYIAVRDLATGEPTRLVDGSRSWHIANGYVAFSLAVGGPIWAAPFDLDRLSFQREPAPILDDVARGWFAHAANGFAVYASAQAIGTRELVRVDRQGQATLMPMPPDNYAFPALSPDDSRLAVSTIDTIWVFDLVRGARHRLIQSGRDSFFPTWRPDGNAVTFSHRPLGAPAGVYSAPADGGGEAELLYTSEDQPRSGSWSADGRVHAFYALSADSLGDVWVLDVSRQGDPVAFVRTPANERAPRFSPDGRWLAYVSDESGRDEVYVRPYPGLGERVTISTDGGREPAWSRSGNRLFYRIGTRMMAASVELGERLVAGTPELVFDRPFDSDTTENAASANYDMTLDGEGFVMVRGAEGNPAQLVLVQNWFAEVERLVPRE